MKGYFRKINNKWSFTIDIGVNPQTGRRKQKTRSGFKTKKEAQDAAAKLQAELSQGTYVEEQKVLFKDFAKQWLQIYEGANDLKPGTIRVRNHEIGRLLPHLANLQMKNITRKHYQDTLDDLKEQGFAQNTLDGIHRTGRMIFKKAVELEIIKKDPTEFAYIKKEKKTIEELEEEEIPNYLEKEELALFLKTADENGLEMDHVMFPLLAYSGIRVGELVALQWKDIDFDNSTISITKTYYNPTNNTIKYQLVTPKSKKGKRTIDMDDYVMNRLRKHLFEQNELKMMFRDSYQDLGFVFAKTNGYPIFIKTVQNHMTRLLKLADLNQDLTPHSLRHTHTSLLAEAGVSLETIMDRLGHKDDDTTKSVYLHVTKDIKKEASHKFAELMKSYLT